MVYRVNIKKYEKDRNFATLTLKALKTLCFFGCDFDFSVVMFAPGPGDGETRDNAALAPVTTSPLAGRTTPDGAARYLRQGGDAVKLHKTDDA